MSRVLIIAEKPSLAKNIVAAIGPMKWVRVGNSKISGYYQNENYTVSYAFGHLLQLNDAEDYDEAFKKWELDYLPIIPESFKYKLKGDAGTKAQYKCLQDLIRSDDTSAIINAGDSDREGEIIIRNIIARAKSNKPVYRLWMPDQTPQTIASELACMHPDSDYDNLANEGYARTYIDWLYGINLTRLATVKADTLLRVGRVTTPIVQAICERERAIRNFVPEKYYVAEHNVDGLKLTSEVKHKTQAECDELCAKYNAARTYVKDKSKTKKTLPRPKLFALSDLQGLAGKKFKYTPQQTLDAVQALYENGYVSYPRTNSNYMSEEEKGRAKDIIDALKKALPQKLAGISFRDSKQIFDSSKVEAHSGLTPTTKFPNLKELPEAQKKLYGAILARFAAVFCTEEYTVDRTTLVISNDIEDFKITGDVVLTPGYTLYEPKEKKEGILPPLNKCDEITPAFTTIEKETKPPEHYTADSLNKYLKNPYSKDEKKELSEDDEETRDVISEVELGTEATRAGLIEAAIKSGYITLANNKYGITDAGEYYVDTLSALGIDMAKGRTLELSKSLKQVYRNSKDVHSVVSEAEEDLRAICGVAVNCSVKTGEDFNMNLSKGPICACPRCGAQIVANKKAFSCENKECGTVIFREDKFFGHFKKKITKEIAVALFTKGQVNVKDFVSAKTGKKFAAIIRADFPTGEKYASFSMEFANQKADSQKTNSTNETPPPPDTFTGELCKCPKCSSTITATSTAYVCSNPECKVALYKADSYFARYKSTITAATAKDLFEKGTAKITNLVSPRTGKPFSANIQVSFNGPSPTYTMHFDKEK